MAKKIILIHGRSTKPAKSVHTQLLLASLMQGLNRVSPLAADRVEANQVSVESVYYGHINNAILAEKSSYHADQLKANDPVYNGAPCLPAAGHLEAIEALEQFKRFDKRHYDQVLRDNIDFRFTDDLARIFSTVSAIATLGLLNEVAIKHATADLAAYLMRRSVGSKIRDLLQSPLRPSLQAGDDICLICHSMGSIVAYDVLWKFSRMSEYRDIQESGNGVSLWLTVGSPLGEAGVKANLYDAGERSYKGGTDKHPRNIIRRWENVAAVDDFISHDKTLRDDYRAMRTFGFVDSIRDHKIYNPWAIDGKANPHKFYGYLANQKTGKLIADWILTD